MEVKTLGKLCDTPPPPPMGDGSTPMGHFFFSSWSWVRRQRAVLQCIYHITTANTLALNTVLTTRNELLFKIMDVGWARLVRARRRGPFSICYSDRYSAIRAREFFRTIFEIRRAYIRRNGSDACIFPFTSLLLHGALNQHQAQAQGYRPLEANNPR